VKHAENGDDIQLCLYTSALWQSKHD